MDAPKRTMVNFPPDPALIEYIHHDEMESIVRETTFDLEQKIRVLSRPRRRYGMTFKLLECGRNGVGGWWLLVCGIETVKRQGYLLLVGYDVNEWKRDFDLLWHGLWGAGGTE